MQGIFRAGLVLACLILIPSVSAFTISLLTVDPSGDLTPGTSVILKGTIGFVPSLDETFNSSHSLQLSTDLEKAKWTYSLVLDGVDNPQPSSQGKLFAISGWRLTYPKNVDESIKFTFTGFAPSVNQTCNITILRVQEVDEKGSVISNSIFESSKRVVNINENPCSCCGKISCAKYLLERFRTNIDKKTAIGINTSVAEEKYRNATQNIATAKAQPSTRYAEAFRLLDSAQNDIADGELLLDRAWAEKEVADAQARIDLVNARLNLLKSTTGTANNPMLEVVLMKRNVSAEYLSDAHAKIAAGKYSQARDKAKESWNKANESYTDSFTIREHSFWEDLFSIPPPCLCTGVSQILYLVLVVVIIGIKIAIPIIAILGVYYLFRKRKGAKPE
jgi:hypothetical protein